MPSRRNKGPFAPTPLRPRQFRHSTRNLAQLTPRDFGSRHTGNRPSSKSTDPHFFDFLVSVRSTCYVEEALHSEARICPTSTQRLSGDLVGDYGSRMRGSGAGCAPCQHTIGRRRLVRVRGGVRLRVRVKGRVGVGVGVRERERVRVTERVRVRVRVEVVDHATDCERGADGVAHLDGTWLGFGLGFGLRVRVS